MHHPVEHRRQDQAGHADEQQPAIDGVNAFKQLARIAVGLRIGPHAAKDHGGVAERPEPAQALEIAIAEHAGGERNENERKPKSEIDAEPAVEQPMRRKRLAAVFEPREEPRQEAVVGFAAGHASLLTRNMTIRRQIEGCVPLTDFGMPPAWTEAFLLGQDRRKPPFPLAAQETPHARPPRQDRSRPLHPDRGRTARVPQPHRHGALDAEPRRPRQRAERAQRALLRAARKRRAHHLRSDPGRARRPGLYLDARHPQRRADQRLAMRDRRGPCRRRPHGAAALACRAHLASVLPARRQAAGGALSHQSRTCRPTPPTASSRSPAHARSRPTRSPASFSNMRKGRAMRSPQGSTASRCMPRTVT